MIEEALRKPICNSHELADAILSYNIKFKDKWKFRALHKLFNEVIIAYLYNSRFILKILSPEAPDLIPGFLYRSSNRADYTYNILCRFCKYFLVPSSTALQ